MDAEIPTEEGITIARPGEFCYNYIRNSIKVQNEIVYPSEAPGKGELTARLIGKEPQYENDPYVCPWQ